MMKRWSYANKRGQFFLLAAVIIITGIVAIASIKTFVSEPASNTQERVYDLSQELGYESAKVIDYGVYNGAYTETLMNSWIETYTNYTRDREGITEWLFVYGNSSEIKIINFTAQEKGEVNLNLGDERIASKAKKELKRGDEKKTPTGKIVSVKDTLGIEREFTLTQGENFYFVVAKIDKEGTVINQKDK
ncbi:MAG: hypothetical protein AABW73_02125 [Nanoarchaeota archaeon]